MYLISLDLSLNMSGFAVFDISKRPKLIEYGVIPNKHFSPNQTGNKLLHLEMRLMTLKQSYNPHVIVKEELVRTKFRDSEQLAKTHGITERVYIGSELNDYNNKEFKKKFTGNGNASKDDVMNEVLKYFPDLHIITDDISDAVAIGVQWLIDNEKMKKK